MEIENMIDDFVELACATVFSSAVFNRIWADAYRKNWLALGPKNDLGVTYTSKTKLGLREYSLSSHGLPWGVNNAKIDSFMPFLTIATKLCKSWNCLSLEWNFRYDSRKFMELAYQNLRQSFIQEKYIHSINLENENMDHYLSHRVKPVTRRHIKLGDKAGVVIRRLHTIKDFDQHDALYSSWVTTKQIAPRPYLLFRNLATEMAYANLMLGAFKDDKLMAAISIFQDKSEWFYWHGTRDMQNDVFFSMDVLFEHAIRMAIESNIGYFNMGGSGGIASLEAYKERWGAQKMPLWHLRWQNPLWTRLMQISKNIKGINLKRFNDA